MLLLEDKYIKYDGTTGKSPLYVLIQYCKRCGEPYTRGASFTSKYCEACKMYIQAEQLQNIKKQRRLKIMDNHTTESLYLQLIDLKEYDRERYEAFTGLLDALMKVPNNKQEEALEMAVNTLHALQEA